MKLHGIHFKHVKYVSLHHHLDLINNLKKQKRCIKSHVDGVIWTQFISRFIGCFLRRGKYKLAKLCEHAGEYVCATVHVHVLVQMARRYSKETQLTYHIYLKALLPEYNACLLALGVVKNVNVYVLHKKCLLLPSTSTEEPLLP